MRRFTDSPYLVSLEPHQGGLVPGKFLTASDLGGTDAAAPRAEFKTVLLDADGTPVVPNGSLGHRFTPEDEGQWNLDLGDVVPPLSVADLADGTGSTAEVDAAALRPRTRGRRRARRRLRRRRARRARRRVVAGKLVTTVFDLLLAQYGVGRDGLPGNVADRLRRPHQPRNPRLAGGDHLGARRAGHPHRARVRRQRRPLRRPLDDPHGRRARTTGSTPTRSTAPSSPSRR